MCMCAVNYKVFSLVFINVYSQREVFTARASRSIKPRSSIGIQITRRRRRRCLFGDVGGTNDIRIGAREMLKHCQIRIMTCK